MNCLKVNPNLLIKQTPALIRNYSYTSLDLLKEYNIPVTVYYNYFISIEKSKLKNLWNHIVKRWSSMKQNLSERTDLTLDVPSLESYHQVHLNIDDEELNNLLIQFVGGSNFKSLFLCNCIQNFIYPK